MARVVRPVPPFGAQKAMIRPATAVPGSGGRGAARPASICRSAATSSSGFTGLVMKPRAPASTACRAVAMSSGRTSARIAACGRRAASWPTSVTGSAPPSSSSTSSTCGSRSPPRTGARSGCDTQ